MATRVFVGGLTYKIRERDLEKFFRKYGRIKEVSMKNGYAFVEFDDHRDADDACYELNGKELMGERITVERARGTPRGSDQWRGSGRDRGYGASRGRNDNSRARDKYGPPTRTEYRVIVENLSSRCSWQDLKDYMRKAGEVTFADAHKLVPNEGVVEFVSYSDMKNAIEKLDDTEINGRRIRVFEDRRGGRKNRSVSRSRSRSRRRSKSRSVSRNKSHSKSRSRSHSKDNKRRSNSRSEDRS
ncbi:serine-arginine protein 55-like [Diorhabda carinulata]|uniref:serine-arginine protein 55-like n=1 Tax=Diorhabda sublineata TaxID=1163346 RepID=UPI0024E0D98A|nr:serine-arginine protein 55-like [Diorhabda sublineata]XP_057655832.1 serine-arginine protein 55-like [Diorhabda carinulata]